MSEQDFSYRFQVDKLGPHPKKIHLEANTDELAGLKERFDLMEIDFFKGTALLQRLNGKKISVDFKVQAKIIQECVATFKPVETVIGLDFQRIYDSCVTPLDKEKEVEIEIDATEELDPIIDGVIDLGAAMAEELGLEIDPFPRADGTAYTEIGIGPEITQEEVEQNNPFAILAELKNKSDK